MNAQLGSAETAQKRRRNSRHSAVMVHVKHTKADALPGTRSLALLTALLEAAADFSRMSFTNALQVPIGQVREAGS